MRLLQSVPSNSKLQLALSFKACALRYISKKSSLRGSGVQPIEHSQDGRSFVGSTAKSRSTEIDVGLSDSPGEQWLIFFSRKPVGLLLPSVFCSVSHEMVLLSNNADNPCLQWTGQTSIEFVLPEAMHASRRSETSCADLVGLTL